MDYKTIFFSDAEQDIADINVYLSQFYPGTFQKFLRSVKKNVENLRTSPYLGAPYRDYRKLVVGDYLVFYKVDDDEKIVRIYRVLHGSRDLEADGLSLD